MEGSEEAGGARKDCCDLGEWVGCFAGDVQGKRLSVCIGVFRRRCMREGWVRKRHWRCMEILAMLPHTTTAFGFSFLLISLSYLEESMASGTIMFFANS